MFIGSARIDIQINVVELKLPQTRINGLWDIRDVGNHFRRHKQLLSLYATLLDGKSQLGLGVVHFSAVEVIISQFQCGLDGLDKFRIDWGVWGCLVPSRSCSVSQLSRARQVREWGAWEDVNAKEDTYDRDRDAVDELHTGNLRVGHLVVACKQSRRSFFTLHRGEGSEGIAGKFRR